MQADLTHASIVAAVEPPPPNPAPPPSPDRADQEEPELPGAHQVLHGRQGRRRHRAAEAAHGHDLLPGGEDVRGRRLPGPDGHQVGRAVAMGADVVVEPLLGGGQGGDGGRADPAARAAWPPSAAPALEGRRRSSARAAGWPTVARARPAGAAQSRPPGPRWR